MTNKQITAFPIFAAIMAGCVIIGLCALWVNGYRAGQINAINGKIEYRLVTQPDGSRTWEYEK